MKHKGVIALEFLLLFPIVIALVYAAAVYGVVFSWQVRMQIAVDRSTAAVMHLDRSSTGDPESSALSLAQQAMEKLRPSFSAAEDETATRGSIEPESDKFVTCEIPKLIGRSAKIGSVPLPEKLVATASAAY